MNITDDDDDGVYNCKIRYPTVTSFSLLTRSKKWRYLHSHRINVLLFLFLVNIMLHISYAPMFFLNNEFCHTFNGLFVLETNLNSPL